MHLPHWTRGRIALVGDAGYCPTPLTGLGTSLALVGAYLLANSLAHTTSHEQAFARYEALLRPYVTTCRQLPPGGVRSYAPKSRAGIRCLTLSMRSMTHWPMRTILDNQAGKAAGITLPAE